METMTELLNILRSSNSVPFQHRQAPEDQLRGCPILTPERTQLTPAQRNSKPAGPEQMLVPIAVVLVSDHGQLRSECSVETFHETITLQAEQHGLGLPDAQPVTNISLNCQLVYSFTVELL